MNATNKVVGASLMVVGALVVFVGWNKFSK